MDASHGAKAAVAKPTSPAGVEQAAPASELASLFRILGRATGVDFSGYRPRAVKRRIYRRMFLKNIETLDEYGHYLRGHPAEVEALFEGILIGVTSFFREPQAFESLKKIAFPELFKGRDLNNPVRVWVPGCSTGEEAYSHAICLLEYMSELKLNIPLQVFGTDVNESAIQKARTGIYRPSIAADVSPARLQRFFTKIENGYQINKSIRNFCIFACQNLITDPPFSRMDIVSCRNLLIYLEPALQRRVIAILHYGLKPNGYLMLGVSEGITGAGADLFEVADQKHRLYIKKPVPSPVSFVLNNIVPAQGKVSALGLNGSKRRKRFETAQSVADGILLAKYAPPTVVIDENMNVIQTRGDLARYLKLASGMSGFNLYDSVRSEILAPLQKAIEAARTGNVSIARKQLQLADNGNLHRVNVDVIPLKADSGLQRMYLVVFNEDVR